MENQNVALDRKKTIKLVTNSTTQPAVVLVDSRACLIDSLINELPNSGQFGQVQSCGSVGELLSNADFKDININMIILSLDVLDTANQNEEIRFIRSNFGETTQIVFLADKPGIELVRYMAEHGINGVIPSSYNTEQAIACLKMIDSGVKFIPPGLLTEHLSQPSVEGLLAKNHSKDLRETLTPRQSQVLELLCIGRSNKYIAAELSLCESTVKVHVSEIMKRLGATSRTHASYLYSKMVDQSDHQEEEAIAEITGTK